MSVLLVNANSLRIPLADGSVQMCVTSPPYWGLRDYGTARWIGGDPECDHTGDQRWYTEKTAAVSSAGAFSEPGEANIERIKKGRWREDGVCTKCGAVHEDSQLGLEPTPELYVEHMVEVFREVKRVLRDDGTLWLNLGDSYNGSGGPGSQWDNKATSGYKGEFRKYENPNRDYRGLKPKDLVGIPWRVAFALQADGWYLRSDIIWSKPNTMPESVTDRPTKSHEYIFLLAKSERYFYDAYAIREGNADPTRTNYTPGSRSNGSNPDRNDNDLAERMAGRIHHGRNRRTVWTIATAPYSGAHFATYPPALVEPCIKAGTSEKGACPACGKAWARVVDVIPGQAKFTPKTIAAHHARGGTGVPTGLVGKGSRIDPVRETLGWQPACTCPAADPIPQIILDPFAGSGTTLMVARSLGRRAIGLDLSYSYLHEQARARLELDKLEAWTNGKKDGAYLGDLPLFMEAE